MNTVHTYWPVADDDNRTLDARDMKLMQGVFLVSLISNGFMRIRLTGGYPCKTPYTGKRESGRGNVVTQTLRSANPAEKSGSDLDGAADTARRME